MGIRQRMAAQLPGWARPENPVLRYMLDRGPQRRPVLRWIALLGWLVIIAGLVGINAAAYDADWELWTDLTTESGPVAVAFSVLYYPLTVMQAGVLALALLMASNAVATERLRGTWESFKVTSHGAEMVIRARWAAVFYQMRWLLVLLIAPRVLFAAWMLAGVTDYQGYHIDLYIMGITPDVPLEGAVILLAAMMTAALAQVPVLIGLYAAVGVLLSAGFHRRGVMLIVRVMLVLVHVVLVAVGLVAGANVLDHTVLSGSNHLERWIGLFGMGLIGDEGLRLMELETFFQTWTDVHYAVLLGGALVAAVAVEIMLTNVLLGLAVRWASRPVKQ